MNSVKDYEGPPQSTTTDSVSSVEGGWYGRGGEDVSKNLSPRDSHRFVVREVWDWKLFRFTENSRGKRGLDF